MVFTLRSSGLSLLAGALLGCGSPAEDPRQDLSPTFGEPIEIPPDQLEEWMWISMPEMTCSDGSVGGFAVNFTDASGDLLLYLQGGGICYDALTCAFGGAPSSVGSDPIFTALDGWVRAGRGLFDRTNESNPLRDSNYVVVPHCTGDHHTGDQIVEQGGQTFHHVGYANIAQLVSRVVPTFRDAERVVLSGFSAGGVGITANYHQIARAFESVGQPSPALMIDAGPFLRPPYLAPAGQQALRERWGLDDTIGAFCSECFTSGYHEIYKVNAALHPELRASLVTTYEDSVVRLLYSVLNGGPLSGQELREGLQDLERWVSAEAPAVGSDRFGFFFYEGEGHGTLHGEVLFTTPGLLDFVNAQLDEG